jgi:DNA-binding beta-propeller fold protein YncE
VRLFGVLAVLSSFGVMAPVSLLAVSPDFVAFESDQVRPLSLSPDGTRLFAVNTPDGRLETFDVTASGLEHVDSTPVGMEPVAVAARSNSEIWVVNHLSDSVSIVDVSTTPARVTRTLLLCDEPRDIVFGGPDGSRAFITTARRGQNCPVPALTTTPGIGRALVTVYDATAVGSGLGGSPLAVLDLFSDKPRALAVSSDGATVYAAAFHSGNQTTSIHELAVCDGGVNAPPCEYMGVAFPGGLPEPNENIEGYPQPEEGLIVRYDPVLGVWKDELERSWNDYVRFDLPDRDVFAIDATATPPVVSQSFNGVGTILFNMAVNPVSGKVYVSNTEARNEVRFANPALFGTSPLRGRQHEARITVLDAASVLPRHLNKHIDYDAIPVPAGVRDRSLSTPLGMVLSSDGATLYVVAMGSNKVGVFRTAELEDNSFVPDAADHIAVAGGPTGLVLNEDGERLYVLTRYDNSVAIIDLATGEETARLGLYNPEPHSTVEGRPFLYDAVLTSSNGEASCASCHVFGDLDSLAWDLGDPLDLVIPNPNPADPPQIPPDYHPLKGPMVTMSLRGMANHGPLHMRGDRTGLLDTPPTDAMNVRSSFRTFNAAFAGLLGRDEGPIDDAAMSSFAAFAERIAYPPNPIRSLDHSLSPSEEHGRDLFHAPIVSVTMPKQRSCQGCHLVDPAAGLYGTDGQMTPGVNDWYKTPHFRNLYQRVGMFGMVVVPLLPAIPLFQPGGNQHMGDQVRGFGFEHAGAVDTVFRFNRYFLFSYQVTTQAQRDQQRRDLEAYMLAFETELAPIVGQQVTLDQANASAATPRIDLLMARAESVYPNVHDASAPECDLVVKGTIGGQNRGWLRRASKFQSDRVGVSLEDADLRALAAVPGQELTYTCAPPGSGIRMALDRDGDGVFDGDEIDLGMNPARPDRILGGGPGRKNCVASFTVLNPSNDPLRGPRGDLSAVQTCTDGDPLCDIDGEANGQCVFTVRACFTTATDDCTSTGLANWQLRLPRDRARKPADSNNAAALHDALLALDFSARVTDDQRAIEFKNPLAAEDTCTDLVPFVVPLRGKHLNRAGKARIVTSSIDAAGIKDTDRIRLVCRPHPS